MRKIKRQMWRKQMGELFKFRDNNAWRRFAKLPEMKNLDKIQLNVGLENQIQKAQFSNWVTTMIRKGRDK